MTTYSRHLFAYCVVLSCFAVLFSSTALQAETIANVSFTETSITIKPVSDFKNISIKIATNDDGVVFTKDLTTKSLIIPLTEISSKQDGQYKLHLTAETGKVTETSGNEENGREAKIYRLKETVNQSVTFQVLNKKILITNIIEE